MAAPATQPQPPPPAVTPADVVVPGLAVVAPEVASTAAGAGLAVGGSVLAGDAAQAAASIMAALIAFLAALREQDRRWLTGSLGRYGNPKDIAGVVEGEMVRAQQFARASADRVAGQLPLALRIADPEQRARAVQQILDAEQRYAEQHQQAMMERAIAAMERLTVRAVSPLGAFWKLGQAQNHTAGCLFMAGRFWPWAVLDRVHPPRHHGCTSSLLSFGEAIHDGLMTPGDVPDTRAAIKQASGVMMEAVDAAALERELDVRLRLVEAGTDPLALAMRPWDGIYETEDQDGTSHPVRSAACAAGAAADAGAGARVDVHGGVGGGGEAREADRDGHDGERAGGSDSLAD